MLDELLRQEGVVEECTLRSRFGFMAFHGGSLEAGTDEVARAAAAASGASYYGVLQPPDFRWHLPSAAFDPMHSSVLDGFLRHVDVVVTVHGYGRADHFTTLLLGGRNRALANHLAEVLRPALPGYQVIDELDDIPNDLRGLHPRNPVNHPPGQGVQLELPPRIRGLGPFWADHDHPGRVPHTEALITGLTEAARTWPNRGASGAR